MVSNHNEQFLNEYNKIANRIHSVALEIGIYIQDRKIINFDYDSFIIMYKKCTGVIQNWVGYT